MNMFIILALILYDDELIILTVMQYSAKIFHNKFQF
jgi:hypothetical protein